MLKYLYNMFSEDSCNTIKVSIILMKSKGCTPNDIIVTSSLYLSSSTSLSSSFMSYFNAAPISLASYSHYYLSYYPSRDPSFKQYTCSKSNIAFVC